VDDLPERRLNGFLAMTARSARESGRHVTQNRAVHVRYVTRADLAEIFSRVYGVDVAYSPVSFEEYAEHMAHLLNMPVDAASGLLGMSRAVEYGRMAYISDDIELLTGRSPQSVEDYCRRMRGLSTANRTSAARFATV
jgi:hypothetical protein